MIRPLLKLTLLSLTLLTVGVLHADTDSERKVSLDWEPVADAVTYDIEIGPYGQNKASKSEASLPQAHWAGVLPPGKYWMRVRGRDERGVPGDWGDRSEMQVKLPKVEIIRPSSDTVLNATEAKMLVLFEWKAVKGAKSYSLYIENEEHKAVETLKPMSTSAQVELPSVAKYRWFVQALDEEGRAGERETVFSEFTLEGGPLASPQIRKPETVYVRQIEFERPEQADAVSVRVQRFDSEKRDWIVVKEWVHPKPGTFPFPTKWPGGRYQVAMRSLKKYRAPSSASEVSFDAFQGARTAVQENRALIRKSLDRTEGWFAQASYVVTQVQYSGVNYESGSKPNFKALTGSFGVAIARFQEEGPWGLNAGFTFGGISVNKKNTLLTGIQALGLWRANVGSSGELRTAAGLVRRELGEASVIPGTTTIQIGKMSEIGIKAGAEYWFALSRKAGIQAHAYYTLPVSAKAATGAAISSGQSLELGLLGSYRWRQDVTLLGGYTLATDKFIYPGSNTATGISGTNSINQTANYLHLMVEYDF